MITLGTVKFNFLTDNEPFALQLNGRWDTFFTTAFEKVADEVLSAYDTPDRVITIESLPLDLGILSTDDFDRHFAIRLRNALKEYMRKWTEVDHTIALQAGIRIETVERAALDVLCFFLLHGYLPDYTTTEYTDLHLLLEKVIGESAYRFREFLESYGHYDFLCRRLVFSFTDEELELIVRVVQPSESKFVNLYVRVQLHSYPTLKKPEIARQDYRNVLWTLVLSYLFSESRSRFSRKQVMMHVLRGIAAHFNFRLAEMAQLMTESIHQLEHTAGQLPELWSLLKEIRHDVRTELAMLDGDYRNHLLREILLALQSDGRVDETSALSYEHICHILTDPTSCRELLRRLQEVQIHRLVAIVVPAEKEYIITYARFLDKNKEAGTFTGKAGSDFRVLKWEFIFSFLLMDSGVGFNRKAFVVATLQRIAAHYNVEVKRLIVYFLQDLSGILEQSAYAALAKVLRELGEMYEPPQQVKVEAEATHLPLPALSGTSDKEAEQWILRLFGADSPMQTYGHEATLVTYLTGFLRENTLVFRTLWRAGRLRTPFILSLVNRTPALRSLWLHRIGDERLLVLYRRWRTVYTALSNRYHEYGFLDPAAGFLSVWMVELTSRNYSAWSETELTRFLVAKLRHTIPPGMTSLLDKIAPVMGKHLTEIINYIDELKNKETMTDSVNSSSMISMHNAGFVLINPYLPMLFSRLGYLVEDRKRFKDTEAMIRAAFLLQYIVYGEEREWPETELFLNKLLIGLEGFNIPLPRSVALSREEKDTVEDMLMSICKSWDKIRRTSIASFRMTFLQRDGYATLPENESVWEVKVTEKAFDILLDTTPWGFKMIKYPWIQYRIAVKWR